MRKYVQSYISIASMRMSNFISIPRTLDMPPQTLWLCDRTLFPNRQVLDAAHRLRAHLSLPEYVNASLCRRDVALCSRRNLHRDYGGEIHTEHEWGWYVNQCLRSKLTIDRWLISERCPVCAPRFRKQTFAMLRCHCRAPAANKLQRLHRWIVHMRVGSTWANGQNE